RLDEEIVVRRGDRLILRRPTPVETLGGGWVIQPKGGKYRFGEETIAMLQKIKEGTPEDLLVDMLQKHIILDFKELLQHTSLDEAVMKDAVSEVLSKGTVLEIGGQRYSLLKTFTKLADGIIERLQEYHEDYPMRQGLGKAELVQSFSAVYPKPFIEYTLDKMAVENELKKADQFIALGSFKPHLPKQWKARMDQMVAALQTDGVQAEK